MLHASGHFRRIHRRFIAGRYRGGSSAATLQMAFPNGRRVSSWGVKHRQARYKHVACRPRPGGSRRLLAMPSS
jgi:hypothetical protein